MQPPMTSRSIFLTCAAFGNDKKPPAPADAAVTRENERRIPVLDPKLYKRTVSGRERGEENEFESNGENRPRSRERFSSLISVS